MNRLFFAILALYLLFTIAFGIVNPIFEAPDEQHHFFNALQIAHSWALPRASETSLARQEAAQPPLYYLLSALIVKLLPISTDSTEMSIWSNPYVRLGDFSSLHNFNAFIHPPSEDWPWQGMALGVHILRFFSTSLGLGTLIVIFQSGRMLWPQITTIPLLATALVAFLPQYEFVHASVTNDTLIIFLCSLALWQMIRLWQAPTAKQWIFLGVIIGMAILTKLTGLLLLGCAIPLLVLMIYRSRQWRQVPNNLLCLLLPPLAISGWLFWRNWLLYGNVTAVNVFIEFGGGERNFPLRVIFQELDRVWASTVAVFGWMNVLPPDWILRLWNTLVILALSGLGISLLRVIINMWRTPVTSDQERKHPSRGPQQEHTGHYAEGSNAGGKRGKSEIVDAQPSIECLFIAILYTWPLLVTVAWLQFFMHTPADQGRLLFPALLPVALALAYGLYQWRIPLLYGFMVGAMLIPPPFIIGYWLSAVYSPASITATSQLPGNAYPINYQLDNGLELVAGLIQTPKVLPGDEVNMILFWRKIAPSPNPALTTIEIVGRDYAPISRLPISYHGGGTLPSTIWPLDTLITERVSLPIEPEAAAPTQGRIWLRIEDVDQLLEIGAVKVAPVRWPARSKNVIAQLGEGIHLINAEIADTQAMPGDTVDLWLRWQIDTPPGEDLVTFVHLGNPTEPPLLQADGVALNGDYPPRFWEAGEVFDDRYSLSIPPDFPSGKYPVNVGLYRSTTGERMPLQQNGKRLPQDGLLVAWLTITDSVAGIVR